MYVNNLISLQENISTYGIDGHKVTGHVTLSSPGMIRCYVQNLKSLPTSNDYIFCVFSKSQNRGVKLGKLGAQKETRWLVEEKNILGSGLKLEDIDGVALVVDYEMRGIETVVVGFMRERYMLFPIIDHLFPKQVTPPKLTPINALPQKKNDDKPYGGQDGGKPYGGKPYDGQDGGKSYGGQDGGKPYGDHDGGKPYGSQDGGKPYGDHEGGKPYGGQDGGKPYGDHDGGKPYGDHDGGEPYGNHDKGKPYGDQDGGKPYGGQDGGKPYGDHDKGKSYDGHEGEKSHGSHEHVSFILPEGAVEGEVGAETVSEELRRIINSISKDKRVEEKARELEAQISKMSNISQSQKLFDKSYMQKNLEARYTGQKINFNELLQEVEEEDVLDTNPKKAVECITQMEQMDEEDLTQEATEERDYLKEIDRKLQEIRMRMSEVIDKQDIE